MVRVNSMEAIPSNSRARFTIKKNNTWLHEGVPRIDEKWTFDFIYYPCSSIRKSENVMPPAPANGEFVASSNGKEEAACTRLMASCTGPHTQFDGNWTKCVSYYKSLPLFDSRCESSPGTVSWQGDSWMCKYLHQYMAPLEPHLHCFHAGDGLRADANGKYRT